MKKLILSFLFLSFIQIAVAQSTDADPAQVPKEVQDKFTKDHPAITPSWKVDGKNFKVFYTDPKNNMGHMIIYDNKGNVLRQENEMDKLASPSTIGDYHTKNFPGETYKVWSVEDKTGVNTYYTERNNKVLWFDKNGNTIVPKEKAPEAK